MQPVQQLLQWTSALHRPFQAIKGGCYTRGSDYTWRVHRKWVIWNRSNELFIHNVCESVWIQIISYTLKCDPVQRCSFIPSAYTPAQNVRHILHVKARWTAAQDFILPKCPIESCESPISNNFKSQKFWTCVIFTCGFRLLCINKKKNSRNIYSQNRKYVDGAKLYQANRVAPKHVDVLGRLNNLVPPPTGVI